MLREHAIEKRVRLKNPKEFFTLIKKSPKYSSWKDLVRIAGCSNTSLKACRRGERTFQGTVFLKLLEYLTEEQKNRLLQHANFLDENWGSKKGTEALVKIGQNFGLSRLKPKTKKKMLRMIKTKESLNKIARATGLKKTTIYYYSRKLNGRTYFEPEFELAYSEVEGEIAGIFAGDGSQYYEPKK